MGRPALAEGLAEQLINEVLDGSYPVDSGLPSETELATQVGVSRLTVREAVKILAAKGVVRVVHGRGTFVNPPPLWSALDPVLFLARSASDTDNFALPRKLLEARRLVEVSVAELAAQRRTDTDLANISASLDEMRSAAMNSDVAAFVSADIAFHQYIVDAADNSIIAALFDPICQILRLTRHQTSFHAAVRENAIEHHARILTAIRRGTPTKAGRAMREHLDQTEHDLDTYVTVSGDELLGISAAEFRLAESRRAQQRPTTTTTSGARPGLRSEPPPKDTP